MKHYTSSELIRRMASIGYVFDKRASRKKGKIVFYTTDEGLACYPVEFSTWNTVAFFCADWTPFHCPAVSDEA